VKRNHTEFDVDDLYERIEDICLAMNGTADTTPNVNQTQYGKSAITCPGCTPTAQHMFNIKRHSICLISALGYEENAKSPSGLQVKSSLQAWQRWSVAQVRLCEVRFCCFRFFIFSKNVENGRGAAARRGGR